MALICQFLVSCMAEKGPMVHQLGKTLQKGGCRVAILPFQYSGRYPQGGLIFYKVFFSEMASMGDFWLAQEGDVIKIMQELMIYPNEKPNFEQLQFIAHRLSADYLITGSIYELRIAGTDGPHITVYIQVYDGETGKILWDTYHSRSGADYKKVMHFGQINTVLRLAKQMSSEIIGVWLEKGMSQCKGN